MKLRLGALLAALAAVGLFVTAWSGLGEGQDAPEQAIRRSQAASESQVLEQRVRDTPGDADALARLAAAYMQRARETGDPAFYELARSASDRALASRPDDAQALVVAGGVALAQHDFARALEIGERARAAHPEVVAVYGVLTDALVELGRYEEAIAAAQTMADLRPDFAALTRVSYLRELHGDIPGAIAAMEAGADAGARDFDAAWARVLAGDLELRRGDLDRAARSYARAEALLPGDAMVDAALARLAFARGDLAEAEARWRSAVTSRPLPEYAIALGELLESQGRADEAEAQYALVRATQQLYAAAGVDADLELALFEADHGDAARAYDLARSAYARRPSIYAADALAWTALRAGDRGAAEAYINQALRLGTRDPRLSYHAGVIAAAADDDATAARHLEEAVEMVAALPPLQASAARRALDALGAFVSGGGR